MPQPRKSLAVHDLQGTTPHDRSADQSHVAAGRPKFPKDLDESLRPIFKRIAKLLQERRVLTAGDCELIRLYVFLYDRHTRNVAALRKEGELTTYIVLDHNGVAHPQVKTNKRLKICEVCETRMAAILNQLGMTPVAKDRAKPVKGEHNPAAVPGTAAWMILNGGAVSEPEKPPAELLASLPVEEDDE